MTRLIPNPYRQHSNAPASSQGAAPSAPAIAPVIELPAMTALRTATREVLRAPLLVRRTLRVTAMSAAFALLALSAQAGLDDHTVSDQLAAEAAALTPAFVAPAAAPVNPAECIGIGGWGPVINWTPHIPVTAAQLPDGRLLTFASNQRTTFPVAQEFTYAAVWDPATGVFTEINNARHDMFCGGVSLLPDGRVVVNGGRNTTTLSSVFDPRTNQWSALPNMQDPRWYNTSVALTDGSVFTAAGTGSPNTAERWTAANGWTRYTNINWGQISNMGGFESIWHPFLTVAPNGRLFHFGPTLNMNWVDTSGSGALTPAGISVPGAFYPKDSAWAVYDEGKILVAAGSMGHGDEHGARLAYTVDLTGATPVATPATPMNTPRRFSNAVILPSGEVMAVGGNTSGEKFSDNGTVLTPEIWNPRTGQWRNLANMSVPRNYHSLAFLLPDGRVWSGGGGLGGNAADHRDAQLFTPPCLFNADGTLATRPVITQAPAVIGHGISFTVNATPGLAKFAFIKLSSATHSMNTDLRYLSLPFTETSAGVYSLAAHANRNVMTPGHWMLFAIQPSGVYSISKIIQVTTATALTLDHPGDQSTSFGETVSLALTFSNPTGGAPVFSASGLPAGLAINSATGVISGTVTAPADTVASVTVTVSAGGQTRGQAFTWSITPARGLTAKYFNGMAFQTEVLQRRDLWVDFDWATFSPAPGVNADQFSVRWTGEVVPQFTETYNFHVVADDGVRLWINGTLLFDSWLDTAPIERTGSISLTAGVPADIRLDYYENGGGAVAQLQWSSARTPKAVIPSSALRPFPTPCPAIAISPATLPGVVQGTAYSQTLTATGGTGPYVWSLQAGQALPGGLTLNATTGAITGTPTVTGTFNFTAVARDQRACVGTRALTIQVNSANRAPVLTNPGARSSQRGTAVSLQLQAVDPDASTLSFSASGLPAGLALNASTGLISGTLSATAAASSNVSVTVSDGSLTDTESFTWTAYDALLLAPISGLPKPAGTPVNLTAQATGGSNVRYKWSFGDGTAETAYSASPSVTKTYNTPGRYIVTVTATDDSGAIRAASYRQAVHAPLTAARPRNSSSVAFEDRATGNDRVWIVNGDNTSVGVFDVVTQVKLAEVAVQDAPRCVAVAPDGRVWVTNTASATISVIDPVTFAIPLTIPLPRGSRPFGVIFDPAGTSAYVALENGGRVLRLNPSTGAQTGGVDVGENVRHLSITADGARVLASRFITPPVTGEGTATVNTTGQGGQVVAINTGTLTISSTIILAHSDVMDSNTSAKGIPNYLGAAAISPDGLSAWVPSKQDNIRRGMLRSGTQLNHDMTVRAIASRIVLGASAEDLASRVDFDNAGMPAAIAYDPWGNYAFCALESSRAVAVFDVWSRAEILRIPVGRAPQGLVLSPDGGTLYVHNFMDRTVTAHDVLPILRGGQSVPGTLAVFDSVTTERLGAQVLRGKQLFYDAKDNRLALQEYMACAACHNDGGHDGRVWDLTGVGEGLRNTITLRGHGGSSILHWTGNFDEVQDFENQIRGLAGGTGLIETGTPNPPMGAPNAGRSADLDALAAYVASLTTHGGSPHRATGGGLTAGAIEGEKVFRTQNCASCHGGARFTISAPNVFRDVGTIKPSTGQRLGGTLPGLGVPTLRGVWATAPYLHDGSAATLADAVRAHTAFANLPSADVGNLVAYLQQIDDAPSAAPTPFTITLATASTSVTGAFDVTSAFSHTPSGYTQSDITVTNGSISNYSASGFRVTPAANGTVTVKIAANLVTDPSGLGNAESNTLSVIVSGTQPPQITLTGGDVGAVGVAGSTTVANGVHTLRGSGADIYNTADAFHFASVSLTGDGEIRARVTSLTNTGDWAKAGVMIRENTTAGSRHAIVYTTPYETGNGSEMMWRQNTGGSTVYFDGFGTNPPPDNWMRLVRTGNSVTGYLSANGTSWTPLQTVSFTNLPSTVLFGLVVCSTNDGTPAIATFDNVQITGAGTITQPPAPGSPGVAVLSSTSARVSWTDLAVNETGYRVERATGGGAFAVISTLGANATSFTDSGLTPGATYSYKVSAFNAAGAGTAGPVTVTMPVASASLAGVDVGSVGVAGATVLAGGVHTLRGAGSDIYGAADAFHFGQLSLSGDGEIRARVSGMTNTGDWAKAGVMIREDLTAGARHAIVYTTPLETYNGSEMMWRQSTGGSTVYFDGVPHNPAPNNWVRLVRAGNSVSGYASANGVSWTLLQTVTFTSLPATLRYGLVVCSTSNAAAATGSFDNVTIIGPQGVVIGGTAPPTGSQPGITLPSLTSSQGDSGSLSLSFTRSASAAGTVRLQIIGDLADSPAGWRGAVAQPVTVQNADGTVTYTFADIADEFPGAAQGFARLHAELDSNGDGFADVEKNGEVFGFTRRAFEPGASSFGNAFANAALVQTTIAAAGGGVITLNGVAPALAGGREYYLEITRGTHEGQRFEINESASSGTTIAIEQAAARTTMATLPVTLVGDSAVIRAHHTVDALFPVALFTAGTQPTSADKLQFFNGSAFETLWLLRRPDGSRQWARVGDATLADAGRRVVDVTEGLLVQVRGSFVTLTTSGIVRANAVAMPLRTGTQLVANPRPGDMSPVSLGMTAARGWTATSSAATSDRILNWQGDRDAALSGYDTFYLLNAAGLIQWTAQGDATLTDLSNAPLVPVMRAAFIKSTGNKPGFVVPQAYQF